jgi:hypothetical protein
VSTPVRADREWTCWTHAGRRPGRCHGHCWPGVDRGQAPPVPEQVKAASRRVLYHLQAN